MNTTRAALHDRLDHLVATQDTVARLASDPVQFPRRYEDRHDQEVVGLIASSLAFGQVTTVRKSVAFVLDRLGPRPAEAIAAPKPVLRAQLKGFVHRIYRAEHLVALLSNAHAVRAQHESLGDFVGTTLRAHDGDLRQALAELSRALVGPRPDRSMRHLVSDPLAGSACKRLNLYLRWMVRPDDGVDLGLWPIDPAHLLMPVDTHVLRISRNLGLTTRRGATWKTAEQITDSLRAFCPEDPVKYDFAICHLGVSRACPSQRVDALCGQCVLNQVCQAYVSAPRVNA